METRRLAALYDNAAEARRAVEALVAAGVPRSQIYTIDRHDGGAGIAGGSFSGNLLQTVEGLFEPEEERHVYAEGIHRGGTLVTVHADQAHFRTALDLLERHNPVDLEAREADWRAGGWTGYSHKGPLPHDAIAGTELDPDVDDDPARSALHHANDPHYHSGAEMAPGSYRAGMRDRSITGTRVRSYAVVAYSGAPGRSGAGTRAAGTHEGHTHGAFDRDAVAGTELDPDADGNRRR